MILHTCWTFRSMCATNSYARIVFLMWPYGWPNFEQTSRWYYLKFDQFDLYMLANLETINYILIYTFIPVGYVYFTHFSKHSRQIKSYCEKFRVMKETQSNIHILIILKLIHLSFCIHIRWSNLDVYVYMSLTSLFTLIYFLCHRS